MACESAGERVDEDERRRRADEVGDVSDILLLAREGVGREMVKECEGVVVSGGEEGAWSLWRTTERRGKVEGLRERVGGGEEAETVAEEFEEGPVSESASSDRRLLQQGQRHTERPLICPPLQVVTPMKDLWYRISLASNIAVLTNQIT